MLSVKNTNIWHHGISDLLVAEGCADSRYPRVSRVSRPAQSKMIEYVPMAKHVETAIMESQNEMGAEIVLEIKGMNISHRLEGLGSLLGNVLGTRLNYQRDPYVHS